MGHTFTVSAWVASVGDNYAYQVVWQGEEFHEALAEMVKAKKFGAMCVKLEWRGEHKGEL